MNSITQLLNLEDSDIFISVVMAKSMTAGFPMVPWNPLTEKPKI